MIDDFEIMDNFKAVYKILMALEKAMDLPEFDLEANVGPDQMGISRERWLRYLEMMLDVGYIKGPAIYRNTLGELTIRGVVEYQITLKGLEYLQENTTMRKIYKAARGIRDIAPI